MWVKDQRTVMGAPMPAADNPSRARMRLPHRRRHELHDFEHAGHRFTAGLGYFETGALSEIFINVPGRSGTAIEAVARDAAILTSIGLQYGASVETIRHALTRNGDGRASGPVGAVLDLLATAPDPH
jgi:hypothetical protein